MQHEHDRPTLVVGATGKTGRRVLERLRERGAPVRAASRGAEPPFDWEDRSTWAPALAGVRAAYVAYVPDLAVPGAPEAIAAFAEVARTQGVERLVLLSGRGEDEAQRAERLLAASGVAWTVVRAAWFAQNFSESFLLEPVRAGEVVLPVDGVREPFVDVEDIADVAVAALLEDGHAGEVYELSGPRLLRFDEALAEIAAATGRPIASTSIPLGAWLDALREAGEPEDVVGLLGFLFGEVLDGRGERLSDGVRRALGRPPRDFADYARRAAAAGVWDPPGATVAGDDPGEDAVRPAPAAHPLAAAHPNDRAS